MPDVRLDNCRYCSSPAQRNQYANWVGVSCSNPECFLSEGCQATPQQWNAPVQHPQVVGDGGALKQIVERIQEILTEPCHPQDVSMKGFRAGLAQAIAVVNDAYIISTSAIAIQKSGQNNEITMNGTERPIESLITESENTQELADKVTAQYGDCQQPHPHMPPYTYSAGISIEALEGLVAEMEARMESNNEKNGKNPYHAGAMTENTGLLFAIALLRRFIDGRGL